MKQLLINVLLAIFPSVVLAQFNDAKMYQAYLKKDMNVWQQALNEACAIAKPTISQIEKIVNYEYGYIAARLDEKKKDEARRVMEQMEAHVKLLETHNFDGAMIAIYRSALCAYEYKISTWPSLSVAMKSIEFVDKAMELAPGNPMVVSLKGNVDFYRPGIVGGSKKRALFNFEKAVKLFEEKNQTVNNWNYIATVLAMAQAYERIGEKEKAILTCEKILKAAPNFTYVKEVYYPRLKKE